MARARNIKPSFFTNEQLGELKPVARLLFAGLWTIADREGRLEDRPKRIKIEVLPYDNVDVNALLDDLGRAGMIRRYVINSSRFIQVINFTKHQNPHIKEAASSIPAPYEHHASTVQTPDEHGSSHADSGFPLTDSGLLIPESPTQSEPASNDAKGGRLGVITGKGKSTPSKFDYPPEFDAWWSLYPRKDDKYPAFKIWKAINPDATTQAQMIAAITEQAKNPRWYEDDGRFCPLPTTWLNKRRWSNNGVTAPEGTLVATRPRNGRQTATEAIDEFRAWAREQQDDDPNVIEAKAVTR